MKYMLRCSIITFEAVSYLQTLLWQIERLGAIYSKDSACMSVIPSCNRGTSHFKKKQAECKNRRISLGLFQ